MRCETREGDSATGKICGGAEDEEGFVFVPGRELEDPPGDTLMPEIFYLRCRDNTRTHARRRRRRRQRKRARSVGVGTGQDMRVW